ncbi:hypothetical protein [Yinghuangia seranimata]|uniref:hypothetical protein n=1 Tax=Yinghuangia seranimata TaxID=408067 RepID=UPI00248B248F|nr:hypothetical protein [Yinghuangia seranimata]MDI2131983.1 hypothetical protein [Yinghuangia seranimata]
MSTIVEFFMAPDDASALRAQPHGPRGMFGHVTLGNFDAEEALLTWESRLTGSDYDDLVDAGEPRVVSDADVDSAVVFALSERLCRELAAGGESRLARLACTWATEENTPDSGVACEILTELVDFARSAALSGDRLYCRVS